MLHSTLFLSKSENKIKLKYKIKIKSIICNSDITLKSAYQTISDDI